MSDYDPDGNPYKHNAEQAEAHKEALMSDELDVDWSTVTWRQLIEAIRKRGSTTPS